MPASSSASISTDGIPHSPNPPTASVAPSGMSATASAADATTLSTTGPPRESGTAATLRLRAVSDAPRVRAVGDVDPT